MKSAKFYKFSTALLILRMTTSAVQNSEHAEWQNSDIPTFTSFNMNHNTESVMKTKHNS